VKRRNFIRSATVLTALSYSRIFGANERIQVGIIGAGNKGHHLWEIFLKQPGVIPIAVCDVHQPYVERAAATAKTPVGTYKDFRMLLEQRDVDAVIVATPDHWHALPTVLACEAGKDVYVEKPLSLRIREGRLMVNVARKQKRVVQTGSQKRSGALYARAVEIIRSGKLGVISHVSAGLIRNVMPGFGKEAKDGMPSGLDWDMWLGPAPYRESLPLPPLYHFRWFWDYSGGQMTNFGAHDLDIVRWAMDVKAPTAVAGLGGRYAIKDGGETPDVQEVIYQFPDFVLTWSIREMNGRKSGNFLEFHGTRGSLTLSSNSFKVSAELWPLSEDPKKPQTEEITDSGSELDEAHVRNFLDSVKTRQHPNADVEEGHLTAVMCHLGNIATRTGKLLRWDAEKEEIISDSQANQWLQYEYRRPWKQEQDRFESLLGNTNL
jgi:predicted dehydrogenase